MIIKSLNLAYLLIVLLTHFTAIIYFIEQKAVVKEKRLLLNFFIGFSVISIIFFSMVFIKLLIKFITNSPI